MIRNAQPGDWVRNLRMFASSADYTAGRTVLARVVTVSHTACGKRIEVVNAGNCRSRLAPGDFGRARPTAEEVAAFQAGLRPYDAALIAAAAGEGGVA